MLMVKVRETGLSCVKCTVVVERLLRMLLLPLHECNAHYSDVIMSAMASQITSLTIVCWNSCSGADQIKYQCSASLAFVRGIHRWLVNTPHKGPVTRKQFPFDDVIMRWLYPCEPLDRCIECLCGSDACSYQITGFPDDLFAARWDGIILITL